jgi:hypothetical protein
VNSCLDCTDLLVLSVRHFLPATIAGVLIDHRLHPTAMAAVAAVAAVTVLRASSSRITSRSNSSHPECPPGVSLLCN